MVIYMILWLDDRRQKRSEKSSAKYQRQLSVDDYTPGNGFNATGIITTDYNERAAAAGTTLHPAASHHHF